MKWQPPKVKALSLSLLFDVANNCPKQRNQPLQGQAQRQVSATDPQGVTALRSKGTVPYPWRDMANSLKGRATAHFDCCVWGALCCVMCAVRFLASNLVESQHWPRQNVWLLHTPITNSAPKDHKYEWMCKLIVDYRCCIYFLILVQSSVGWAMIVQKVRYNLARYSTFFFW